MALDFLILYEHTVREYESDLLLKLELERRGYTVRIRQLLDAKDLRLFGKDKPEVLVASCMYDNEAINSHVYNNIGRCNKIVNLHWEQMLSDTQEEGDWFNMNGNAKRCVQTCWGKRTAARLQAHGMDAKNTPVTGAVMMDFLRPEFDGYFKDKETLCREFGLDPAKQLHLYISSFGYASMTRSPSFPKWRAPILRALPKPTAFRCRKRCVGSMNIWAHTRRWSLSTAAIPASGTAPRWRSWRRSAPTST